MGSRQGAYQRRKPKYVVWQGELWLLLLLWGLNNESSSEDDSPLLYKGKA